MTRTLRLFALLPALALLGGCVTQRTATYPGRDYDAVFKGAVAGLCAQPNLLVYGADKRTGIISVQGRGLMGGPPDSRITIGREGGTPTAKVFPPMMQDFYLEVIGRNLPAAAAPAQAPAAAPATLDFEKQKLELEKQKLELEREKFELEKRRQQQPSK